MVRRSQIKWIILLFFSFLLSCKTNLARNKPEGIIIQSAYFVVSEYTDLKGDTLIMPSNSTISIGEHGQLANGVLVGNNTKILSVPRGFDNIMFVGSFIGRSRIEWFDIVYNKMIDNSANLNSALTLAACSSNKLLKLKKKSLIYIRSDFEDPETINFLLKGTVEIKSGITFDLNQSSLVCIPNKASQYNILFSRNSQNICIKNGFIVGDKNRHQSTKGEWGYGIELQGVKNYTLDNLVVSNCWGDGINIQVSKDGDGVANSKLTRLGHCINGRITNCKSSGNRRQGMSIEGAIGLNVSKCVFENTSGTYPNSGVDLEPYSGLNTVSDVSFSNCSFSNNDNSGLFMYGDHVSNIKVQKCLFSNNKGASITVHATHVLVSDCFDTHGGHISIHFAGSDHVNILNTPLRNLYCESLNNQIVTNSIVFEGCSILSLLNHGDILKVKKTSMHNDISLIKCIVNGVYFNNK